VTTIASTLLAEGLQAALPDPEARVAVLPIEEDHGALLSPAEQERAERFRFPKRRREWTAGRAAAKLALRDASAGFREPGDLTILTDPSGQPRVTNAQGYSTDFGVSITHAGGVAAALAFPLDRPIGLDLEPVAVLDAGLAILACTEQEQRWLAACPEKLRTEALLRIWTAKEAAVKLTGTGLGVPLTQVRVEPIDLEQTEVRMRLPSSEGIETGCRVRVRKLGDWIAALAWFPG
jgi:4'-phosphopantetheinyl transferase